MKYERTTMRPRLRQGIARLRDPDRLSVARNALRVLAVEVRRLADRVTAYPQARLLSLRPATYFEFEGRSLAYFRHHHNRTWRTERSVELPIVLDLLGSHSPAFVLEVGNVVGHYRDRAHVVVDKYEPGPGVRNVDVLDFNPRTKYDLLISVSTLEHVGWDERLPDPRKLPQALDHLRTLIAPGGQGVVTVPLGYNPHLDAALRDRSLAFDDVSYFERDGLTRWRQVTALPAGAETSYGNPFPAANVLAVCHLRVPAD